jgi:hypothetical protein
MRFMRLFLFVGFFLFLAVFGHSETDLQKGARIVKMSDDLPIFGDVKAYLYLRIYDKDGDLKFNKKMIIASHADNIGTPDEIQNFLGYFQQPAEDIGNSMLYINYKGIPSEKYIYLKSIRKTKKVTGADKKLSFFGSDFTNSDAGKPDYFDWNYRFLSEEQVEFKGKMIDCYVVEFTPRTAQVKYDHGYGKKILYYEKNSFLTMREDFFDEQMNKIKEMNLLSFIVKNNVRGKKVFYVTGLEMKNLKTGGKTRMLFADFLFEEDANIRKGIFNIQYLTQKWW